MQNIIKELLAFSPALLVKCLKIFCDDNNYSAK